MFFSPKDQSKDGEAYLELGHYVVITLSLLLTVFAWYITSKQTEDKVQERFFNESSQIISLVLERMKHYEDALWSGVAMIKSNQHTISYNKWKLYVESLNILEKYPGINGIGVIYKVEHQNMLSFIERIRKEGVNNFNPYPKHARDINFPITYITPLRGNEKAIGLDMAHEDNRYRALIHSAQTDTSKITGPIVLVQDAKKTPGFLFYAPFYNKMPHDLENFEGAVYAPFIVNKLLDGVLSKKNRNILIKISDGQETIYSEFTQEADSSELLKFRKEVNLYGRSWIFEIVPGPSFNILYRTNQPLIILMGGIIIDVLIVVLFLSINNSKRKAKAYAAKLNKQLIETNANLDAILNSAKNTCIIQTDDKGNIKYINKGAYLVTQSLIKSAQGIPLLDFLQVSGQNDELFKHFDEFRNYCNLKGKNNEAIIVHKNVSGLQKIYLDVYFRDVNNTSLIVASDITKEIELDKLKNDFVSTVNHELRTPLTAIKASHYILREKMNNDSAEAKSALELSERNCDRMLAIVNDLLDMSKIEKGILSFEILQTDLKKLVNEVIEQNKAKFIEKKLTVTFDNLCLEESIIDTDPGRLNQVINNVISNAIKVSPNEGEIRVTLNLNSEMDEYLITVKDQGPGIPEEFQKKIFNKFSQLDSKINREIQGSGLGLYISQKIMTVLGGYISFDSILGEGATFQIHIYRSTTKRETA